MENSKIGFVKFVSYKRIGRVHSIKILRKVVEDPNNAYKSKSEN